MATATIYATKEHSIAYTSGGLNVGTSNETHAPIGEGNSGWDWKELIRFPLSASDFNGITQITECKLKIKTTGGNHCTNDSGTMRVRGLNGSFAATGGGSSDASDSWKTNANPTWPISAIGTTGTLGSRTGAWADTTVYEIDVTDYIEKYAPASILKRDGTPCDDEANYGMVVDMNGAANVSVEFKSMRASYTPRLVVTGTVTPTPEAPTNLAPSGTLADIPTDSDFSWDGDAGDESPLTYWDFAIVDAGTGATPSYASSGGVLSSADASRFDRTWGISGVDVSNPAGLIAALAAAPTLPDAGTITLARGNWYAWQVRHENSEGTNGDWSAIQTFYVQDVPDAPTLVNPTVAKPYAPIGNLDEAAVWTGTGNEAKATITFTYSHPDGVAGTHYTITWGGTPQTPVALAMTDGQTYTVDAPAAQGRGSGNSVTMTMTVTDQNGNESAASSSISVVTQWAQGIFNYNHGSGAGDFAHSYVMATDGQVAFLYRKADGTPGDWYDSIGDVTPSTHLDILVRLATDDSTVNPQLTSQELEYVSSGSLPPDQWEVSSGGGTFTLDSSKRRFGRRSAKFVAAGTGWDEVRAGYKDGTDRDIIVTPGEKYTFSIYLLTETAHTSGKTSWLFITDTSGTEIVADSNPYGQSGNGIGVLDTGGAWERFALTFTIPDGVTRVRPYFGMVSTTGQTVWMDSAQFEEGEIATQWKPGGIGPAVSIDVGGIQIDAEKGGIFRLLSADGTQVVQMEDGLTFKNVSDATEATIENTGGSTLEVSADLDVVGDVDADNVYSSAYPVRTLYEYADSPAVWSKPSAANFSHIEFEMLGAGGGGGGGDNTASTEGAAGGGGGAGGYIKGIRTAAELPSTLNITIGAGGSGGSAAGGNGSSGGNTVVGNAGAGFSAITAGGGGGGDGDAGGTGRVNLDGGSSGTNSGHDHSKGDIEVSGMPGSNADRMSLSGVSAATGIAMGRGGHTLYGSGGRHNSSHGPYGSVGYGAGGTGSWQHNSDAADAGGDGKDGLVVITEYYLPLVKP